MLMIIILGTPIEFSTRAHQQLLTGAFFRERKLFKEVEEIVAIDS